MMTRVGWLLVETVSRLLDQSERDVVRGDLAECGVRPGRALREVAGLVIRRQGALWADWRPWLAIASIVIPIGVLLSHASRWWGIITGVDVANYWVLWDFSYLAYPGYRKDVIRTAVWLGAAWCALAGWSWTSGFVVGRLSRRTLWLIVSLFALVVFAGTLGTGTVVHRAPNPPLQYHLILVVFPRLARTFLVILPMALAALRDSPRPALLTLLAVSRSDVVVCSSRHPTSSPAAGLDGVWRASACRRERPRFTRSRKLDRLWSRPGSARSRSRRLRCLCRRSPAMVAAVVRDDVACRLRARCCREEGMAREKRARLTRLTSLLIVMCTAVGALGVSPFAQNALDYPQWRGQTRDGAAAGFVEPGAWPQALKRLWKVDVGEGYATPLVIGDVVYVFTRRDEQEAVTALDAATGRQRWQSQYPVSYTPSQPTKVHGAGPKATPLFLDGKLLTQGISGIASAFYAASGKRLWQTREPVEHPFYSAASSPAGEHGLMLVHPGNYEALTAYDVNDGMVKWTAGDGGFFMSPLIATLEGTRQVVTVTQSGVIGVAIPDGRL